MGGQPRVMTIHEYQLGGGVDLEIPERQGRFRLTTATPQLRPDPSQQFLLVERLGDVVIGTRSILDLLPPAVARSAE